MGFKAFGGFRLPLLRLFRLPFGRPRPLRGTCSDDEDGTDFNVKLNTIKELINTRKTEFNKLRPDKKNN